MNENGIYQILSNHPEYGTCLELIVHGTRERAESIAKKYGKGYWVEDGTETDKAFKD